MTPQELAETAAYIESLRSWNPGLAEYREQMPAQVQRQHMLLDEQYERDIEELERQRAQ